MQMLSTRLDGPLLLAPVVHRDQRGFFLESYRFSELERLGVDAPLLQQNHSRSRRGIVRGMHFQPGMGKLVRCARGAIVDVVVDIRRGSPAFGRWESFELNDDTHHQLYCPDGFAHGFCVVSDTADVVYDCTSYYDSDREAGFRYDDPEVGIEWPPGLKLEASARDSCAPLLSQIAASLPFEYVP
jgi:dTDP-4-dehydrorhamnose 3,5-epimerase